AARHLPDVGVGILQQLAMLGDVALEALTLAKRLDRLLELRALAREGGVFPSLGDDRGIGDQPLQLLVPTFDLCETLEHGRPSRPQPAGGVVGSVSWASNPCRSPQRSFCRTCD